MGFVLFGDFGELPLVFLEAGVAFAEEFGEGLCMIMISGDEKGVEKQRTRTVSLYSRRASSRTFLLSFSINLVRCKNSA